MLINLAQKIALITGASGGIGKAITKALHRAGAHVIISGSNTSKLEALGAELGSNYTIKVCNLKEPEEVQALMNSIDHLDILVCNAGITMDSLSLRMSDEFFNTVIDVNLKANFILNREAIKKMMRARFGRIINIASIVGVSGNSGQANYAASKAGLIGMSKSLAIEVASRGITVNVIAPGFIESEMTAKLTKDQQEMILNKIPQKQIGKPDDIANAALYLASDYASYITGQTIHINGGMLMV